MISLYDDTISTKHTIYKDSDSFDPTPNLCIYFTHEPLRLKNQNCSLVKWRSQSTVLWFWLPLQAD